MFSQDPVLQEETSAVRGSHLSQSLAHQPREIIPAWKVTGFSSWLLYKKKDKYIKKKKIAQLYKKKWTLVCKKIIDSIFL